jgi:aldehyde dehydrogenase (NAD+)
MPTVIESPHPDSFLMKEEIFGPILPIIPYHDINNVINEIKERSKPLAVYLFSENKKNIKEVKERTSSGAFVVNDSVVQILNCHLPFGGVGMSGSGRYHGKAGFTAFSNPKIICQTAAFNMYPLSTRFAPYTESKKRMMTFLLKIGGVTYHQLAKTVGIVSIAIAGAVIGLHMRHML